MAELKRLIPALKEDVAGGTIHEGTMLRKAMQAPRTAKTMV